MGWTGIEKDRTKTIEQQVKDEHPEIVTIERAPTVAPGRRERYDVWQRDGGDLVHVVWIIEHDDQTLWIKQVDAEIAQEIVVRQPPALPPAGN